MAAANPAGRIAFARTQKGVVAGVVTDRGVSRMTVLVPGGGREVWGEDRVFHTSDARVPLHSARAALDGLEAFRERVDEARTVVDIEVVWDLVLGTAERVALRDLAEIVFPSVGPEHVAAVACALAEDETFFHAAGDGAFTPLPREAVEAARRRRERESQEQAQVDRAVAGIGELLGDGAPAGKDDPATRLGVAWLKALVIAGRDEGGRGLAVYEGLQAAGLGAGPDPEQGAFHVLVRLHVFDEDEVLAVHRNRVRLEFPPEVLEEAARIAAAPLDEDESAGRAPLAPPTGIAGPVAIDDPWTTEVDDALMVEPAGVNWRVHVLIADPSARVRMGSGVAEEGMARAATLYLPTGKVPMLPEVLSSGSLSLAAGEARPMMDFEATLAEDGRVPGFRVVPVLATLDRRLTYDETDALVASCDPRDPLAAAVARLHALATRLRERRVEAGAVLVERDEVSVRVEGGEVVCRRLPWDSPGRRLVAEFMVLACTQTGDFARHNGIPTVYRRQSPPDDRNATAGLKPGTRAYAFRAVRSLRRAELTTQPDLHWGLGVVGYTQVTSPLRRFQDFIAHVQLKGFVRHGRAPLDTDRILRMFGDLESRCEAVLQTEREAKRYFLLKYLKRSIGGDVTGEVVAVTGSRAIVALDETGLELPLPGAGHLALGTHVVVRVREVDPRRDRVSLTLA